MPNTYEDPQIAQQRALAQALMQRGMNPQPVGGQYRRTNQAADLVSALMGSVGMWNANRRQTADDEAYRKTIADALNGPQADPNAVDGQPGDLGFGGQDPNEHLIQTLAGNKRTAPMALEYALQQKMRGGPETPSDILSFREVQKMNPQDRELFFQTKRGAQIKEVGGVPSVISGREVTPLSTLDREAAAGALKEGAKTGAKQSAELRATAGADLPRIEDNATQMLGLLSKLDKADLGLIFGAASVVPVIPGTEQANVFSDWEQLQGKAFLEAFNSLKGAGQITEVEGQKATAAITSLSQRKQDPEKAREAIAALKAVIATGVERARKKAGMFDKGGDSGVIEWESLPSGR